MVCTMSNILLTSLWDDKHAASLDEPGKLLYRSNLLGADLRITNFGGGNTSAKVTHKDPLTGKDVTVLWVKGSGGDLGSMKLDGFATLYMDKLESLKSLYKSLDQEDAMVHALNHCIFNLNPRARSIDTCLQVFCGQLCPISPRNSTYLQPGMRRARQSVMGDTKMADQNDDDIPFMQKLLDNHFLLLFLGVASPGLLYILWGIIDIMNTPLAK